MLTQRGQALPARQAVQGWPSSSPTSPHPAWPGFSAISIYEAHLESRPYILECNSINSSCVGVARPPRQLPARR